MILHLLRPMSERRAPAVRWGTMGWGTDDVGLATLRVRLSEMQSTSDSTEAQ